MRLHCTSIMTKDVKELTVGVHCIKLPTISKSFNKCKIVKQVLQRDERIIWGLQRLLLTCVNFEMVLHKLNKRP